MAAHREAEFTKEGRKEGNERKKEGWEEKLDPLIGGKAFSIVSLHQSVSFDVEESETNHAKSDCA